MVNSKTSVVLMIALAACALPLCSGSPIGPDSIVAEFPDAGLIQDRKSEDAGACLELIDQLEQGTIGLSPNDKIYIENEAGEDLLDIAAVFESCKGQESAAPRTGKAAPSNPRDIVNTIKKLKAYSSRLDTKGIYSVKESAHGALKEIANAFDRESGSCPCTAGPADSDCQNGGTPTGTSGNCQCNCKAGYSGSHCEIADACTTGPADSDCQNGGTPTGTSGNCQCNCKAGYSGSHCEIADEESEAANDPCADQCSEVCYDKCSDVCAQGLTLSDCRDCAEQHDCNDCLQCYTGKEESEDPCADQCSEVCYDECSGVCAQGETLSDCRDCTEQHDCNDCLQCYTGKEESEAANESDKDDPCADHCSQGCYDACAEICVSEESTLADCRHCAQVHGCNDCLQCHAEGDTDLLHQERAAKSQERGAKSLARMKNSRRRCHSCVPALKAMTKCKQRGQTCEEGAFDITNCCKGGRFDCYQPCHGYGSCNGHNDLCASIHSWRV